MLLLQSGPRFRSSFRILDNDKCDPGFGMLLLQPDQAPFQLPDSAQFKDLTTKYGKRLAEICVLLLQSGQAPFQLQNSARFKDLD